MTSIKEMVANGRKVRFTHYKSDELWYVTECGFAFPVPVADTGDGSFLAEDSQRQSVALTKRGSEVQSLLRAPLSNASLAHGLERWSTKPEVEGSTPSRRTTFFELLRALIV